MRKISLSIRKRIGQENWFKKCCLCGVKKSDQVKIEVHHNFIYAGRQTDVYFTLLPLCVKCHDTARKTEVREKLDWIMMGRADWNDLARFPRYDWKQRKIYLEGLFGIIVSLTPKIHKRWGSKTGCPHKK
jgi:hypothetical protein